MYYEEADDQLLNDIRSMNIPAYTGEDSMDAGYRDIIRFMRKPNPNMVHELRVDFCRTFIGGGNDGYSAAYPFESVYSSPRRLMMQNARDEILVLYRAAGLDKSDVWSEGEDHIVAELEFMQVLGQRACDYLMAGDLTEAAHQLEVSLSFLEDHLRAWFPMMAADMRKFAKTSFYRGLADVTIGFFDSDLEFLHDMLVPDSDVAAPREVEDEIVLDLS
ncbi:MAG: molecular chaperone TorD family protein [Eggerthellaceae bacterium]|nr:molecular chaperone TorD family protein [Eggerthellaceae bacterium]